MSRRFGRWVYNSNSTRYGEAGWHLDGSPLVLDFMPGHTDGEPGRGLYLLYNWPWPGKIDGEPVSKYMQIAMDLTEQAWDERLAREMWVRHTGRIYVTPALQAVGAAESRGPVTAADG